MRKKKILVVDDRDDQWTLIRAAMASSMPDTEAVWVRNPNQALDYLHAQSERQLPNLILLDLYLPGRDDGWQCLEAIKQSKVSHLLPIVIFSHSDLKEDVKGSYDLGCSSYLVKSSDPRQWLDYFTVLHNFWWQISTLPPKPFY
ncbi:response regulator [Spirosoma fluviale]|uniref:CheY chemotaxis protein or a CheY-like REC (Receiver) domain n=1 Tax=Spirosoma fluviale TaxID=1597977 RepID=A0A286G4T0_9BACT|nr:response regulator [Spirosoma fluviale]SOD90492.1 CheY chemotaxis protein or a CheY-like REC (receiver) domain [Spirosoma fluviale]